MALQMGREVSVVARERMGGRRPLMRVVAAAAATVGLLVAVAASEATVASRSFAAFRPACTLLPVTLAEKALSSKVTVAAEFQGTKSAAYCTFANPRGGGASSIAILVQAGSAELFTTDTAKATLTLPGFGGDARCNQPAESGGFFTCVLLNGGAEVTVEVYRTTGTTHYTVKPVSKATMIELCRTIWSRL